MELLGEKLGPADLPSNSSRLVAALVYYLENGTTAPPAPPTAPDDIPAVNAAEAEVEALRQRVSELESQNAPTGQMPGVSAETSPPSFTVPPSQVAAEPTPPPSPGTEAPSV